MSQPGESESNERGRCPRCQGLRVWHNGLRWRKASVRREGETVYLTDVPVRRLCCGDCRCRWSRTSEPVVTRAHYQPCVVAAAVAAQVMEEGPREEQRAQEYGCHRRTLQRFVERVARMAEPAQLVRRLLQVSGSATVPRPAPVRRRRSAALEQMGQRAVWVLALLDALASWLGLGMPGLAHAGRIMPAFAAPSGGGV